MTDPYLGEIRAFGFGFTPRGWALCDGQLLPIAQYTALYSLLGTIYGGNGRTTFALPNLQGRAAMQPRQGPGLRSHRLGDVGGAESVTLTPPQLPAHTHTLQAVASPAESATPKGKLLARVVGGPIYSSGPATVALAPSALTAQGEGQPHNNLPPYLTLNFCIAVQGLFPSRP
ncbi:phage tail protein [Deinococcus aerophilus]|uniref:Tail Collar domain-containing protein n=1 Tax=Deinococcus aerophilus TaxID=522488 RepID=A0ABQ2GZQ4_9DEIO|nr:tail fiber protein [Deinococcus aerophilus]GGM19980.1 tail Collar domain-containing protein [Deinococcus aerophilus]